MSQSLLNLSAKSGISLETLQLIQQKRLVDEQRQKAQESSRQVTAVQKTIDFMCQVHQMLSQQFMLKSKQVMPLQELCQSLQRTLQSQSKFFTAAEISQKIKQMASLCPEVYQLRLGGRHLRLDRQFAPADVRKFLEQRYSQEEQPEDPQNPAAGESKTQK